MSWGEAVVTSWVAVIIIVAMSLVAKSCDQDHLLAMEKLKQGCQPCTKARCVAVPE